MRFNIGRFDCEFGTAWVRVGRVWLPEGLHLWWGDRGVHLYWRRSSYQRRIVFDRYVP